MLGTKHFSIVFATILRSFLHLLFYDYFINTSFKILGLNNLQSGVHRQYMKDLFVELCLTVPVRLRRVLFLLPHFAIISV